MDGRGLPVSIILTAGQAGDNPHLLPLLDQINIGRTGPAPHLPGPSDRRQDQVGQAIYANRNVVERRFNRLKQFRDLATGYAERAAYYRAEIIIASIVLWLRTDLQDTA